MALGLGRAVAEVRLEPAAPAAAIVAAPAAAPATPRTTPPARNASRAAAMDDADVHRSAGSVASALRSIATRSGGMPERTDEGSGGGPARRAIATAAALSASHGRCPVSSSYRTMPSE